MPRESMASSASRLASSTSSRVACRLIHEAASIGKYIVNAIFQTSLLINQPANANDNSQHQCIFDHVLAFFAEIRSEIIIIYLFC